MSKIIKNENQRIAVLVDVQNLYYSAKNHFASRVNFSNLLKVACAGRVLIRAIAYVIKSDEREVEFFDAVNNAGFEIHEKEIQIFGDGSKKGDWDVGIAMDAIRLGEKVDSIILVSGDGDYIPVVTYLQQRFGCLVEVIAFNQTCSNKLKETADDFIAFEDNKSSLLFKTRSSIGSGKAAQRKIAEKNSRGGSSRSRSSQSGNRSSQSRSRKSQSSQKRSQNTAPTVNEAPKKKSSRIKKLFGLK